MVDTSWPTVAICIVTYDRIREIKLTIRALQSHFHYTGLIKWHIADDGSPHGYMGQIYNEFPDIHFTHTITQRKGWGANVNTALHFLKDVPYVFLCEDDYVARRDLDITAGVALMETESDIALVRYDGVAAHALTLHLKEVETRIGRFSYCIVDRDSPHLNVYSNRPHLKSKQFHSCYGWYPENKPLGITETEFAHRIKDKKDCPNVAILGNGIETAFDHIGASRQGTQADLETIK